MAASDDEIIRALFADYIRMYASRDDRLTESFSDNFSGFTGGGANLVKDRQEWVAITRQDFAQVPGAIQIELKDLSVQSLTETVAIAAAFFTIHLPMKDHPLSRETARLVLVFRKEPAGWKIVHSGISIPYYLVQHGEVYPLKELTTRNQLLEERVEERTRQLVEANQSLQRANEELKREMQERQLADQALQKSEERYRSILNASPDDITITDPFGRIIMVSPMALTIFRFSNMAEIVGRAVTDYLVPGDRDRAVAQMERKRQGITTGPSEYRALRPDGTTFDIEVNSEFIRDAAGTPTGMVVIVRDITERKRAEADREKLKAQSRQIQKMQSLARMAGAIAHHFNNQLQAVMTGVELARCELPPGSGGAANLADAQGAVAKAAEVSRLMLTYLGQTGGERELLDLSETCARCLALLRAVVPKGVVLESELPLPGPGIRASENQLHQVLTNLVTNAWEAMADGAGTIHVRVRTVPAPEGAAVHRFPVDVALQEGAHACLEVEDTGCGMGPAEFEKLFDPFYSSKFTGRGLGLAAVLGIVRAHEGAITVQSAPGQGSTFRVYLPVSAETVARKPVAVLAVPGPAAGGTVLVVDDEAAVQRGITRALMRQGYSVLSAEDGVQAVEVFRERRGEIGCVLCDVTMPRMNGWQTLKALRELAPGIPVILASGYNEAQVMEGHPERPDLFLGKPYDLDSLFSAIRQVMSGKRCPES